jgi:RimJ/RimL family protein N-acetyltransferase
VDYLFAPDRLDTPEFTIRALQPGDGPLLGEAIRDSYDHLHPYMAWAKPDYPDEEGERIARTSRGNYLLAQDFGLIILAPGGDRCLGGTGFHLREGPISYGNAEIGMWIRGNAAGKGLGTKVLVALLRWGFEEWPWVRLSWRCDSTNIASARTAEKAGMHKEGCLRSDYPLPGGARRDTFVFSALKSEWLARHRD